MVGYDKLREEQAEARKQGKLMGIGISHLRRNLRVRASPATPAGGWESATVKIEPIGQSHGADRHLAARPRRGNHVRADRGGRTGRAVSTTFWCCTAIPRSCSTASGRSAAARTAVGGTALYFALQELKDKIKKFGAMLLESDDVTLRGRPGAPTTRPAKSVAFTEIAARGVSGDEASAEHRAGPGRDAFLGAAEFHVPLRRAHRGDAKSTGKPADVKIRRYVAVDDCGNILNPLIVDGQVHGGVAQGIGQALWEQAVYDDNGQLVTGEFMDYAHAARAHDAVDRKRPHDHAVAGESAGRERRGRSGNHRVHRRPW